MFKVTCLLLAVLIFIVDQWTKCSIIQHVGLYESRALLPFFNFTLLYNQGSAFSFLSDAGGGQRWFLVVVNAVISLGVFVWLMHLDPKKRSQSIALALIFGGAMGNIVDRIRYGYVVDFLDFHIHHWHWPVFNIADAFVCIGAVLLLGEACVTEQK